MNDLLVDPVQLEASLGPRLRSCRLVFEILDDATIAETSRAIGWFDRQSPDPIGLIVDRYPALLTTYLVAEAIEKYQGGTFWPHLSLPTRQADQTVLGTAFIKALRTFRLETFEFLGLQGMKYVTPILAHAGIPRYCVGDFFYRLLIPQLRRGFGATAGELLAAWRARQTAFVGIDVPVQRFVLYGGSPAVDLVDRCIDLIAESSGGGSVRHGDSGLPRHIADGLKADAIERERAQQLRSRTVASPQVRLDPWEPLGPVLELPPLPRDLAQPSWLVEDGTGSRSVAGSVVQSHLHRWAPARAWSAELQTPKGPLRTSVFERLPETGVAAFDPKTGLLARDPHLIPWAAAWLLMPADIALRFIDVAGTPIQPPVVELPSPAGLWHGHSLREYDLRGLSLIEAELETNAGRRRETLRIVPSEEARAALEGPDLDGVTTESGLPVYSQVPHVVFPNIATGASTWKIHLRFGRETVDVTAAEAGFPKADLGRWLGDTAVAAVRLRVTGPIGSDLRTEFAVVRNLQVSRPDDLILPGAHVGARVSLAAPACIHLQAHGGALPTSLVVGVDEDVVRCWASAEERLLLLVQVPRLVWAIARCDATGQRLATTVQRVALDELEESAQAADAIVVSTRCPGLPLSLRLHRRGTELCTRSEKTSRDGRAAFLLAPFRDAAVASGVPTLQFDLLVAGRRVEVAELFVKLRVSNLDCQLIDAAQGQELSIAFEARVQFARLEARVWAAHRPWEDQPTRTLALPTGGAIATSVPMPGPRCPPGRYVVEVAIPDEWHPPARPHPRGPNTVACVLGDPQAGRADLHRRAEVDAVAALELLLVEGVLIRDLNDDEQQTITPLGVRALLDRLRETDQGEAGPPPVLRELLARQPRLTATALARLVASGSLENVEALGFAISLLPLPSTSGAPGWSEARAVWLSVPYVAAQLDVPAAMEGDEEAIARCREFLGWEPGSPPVPGLAESSQSLAPQQALLGAPPEVLQVIKGAIDLLPGPLLTLDEFASAGFEWLIRGGPGGQARQWWEQHQIIPSLAPPSADLAIYHLGRRAPPSGVSLWAGVAQITLASCLALLEGQEVRRVRQALSEAIRFAPRLVGFDLALAAVLRVPTLQRLDSSNA